MDASAEIERLSRRRQDIWSGAESAAGETDRIAKQLAEIYELKREHEAQAGTPKKRTARIAAAGVERELERLMTS